jgi:hypothetical protein
MRKGTFFAAAAAAVLVGAIGAYSAVAGDGSGGRTFTVHEQGTGLAIVPAATSTSPPLGDVFVLSANILDDRGRLIGRDGGACTTTAQDGTVVCNLGLKLPGGELTFGGLANGPDNVFAITGGTGIYRNARGEAHAVDTSPLTSNVTITLIGG